MDTPTPAHHAAADWKRLCIQREDRRIKPMPSVSFLGRYWRVEMQDHHRAEFKDADSFRGAVIQVLIGGKA